MGRLDQLGDSVRQVIRAYHGSPYDFDKFDASKIGTGEGAQAYGHGLYFAGHEPVARRYRDMLALDAPYASAEEAAAEYLAINGGDAPSALKVLSMHAAEPGQFGYGTADQQEIIRRARELVESGAPIAPRERTGHMYEVEIGHPEAALLDLDAPASGNQKAALLQAAFNAPGNKWQRMAMEEITSPRTRSKAAVESLMRAYNAEAGDPMAGRVASQAAVSESLMRGGVPGAMYFDRGSRSVGEGTRNYVMFPGTEDSIRILRKYGMMAPIAAGAASGEE